jgi:hypothetical protein
MNSPQLQQEGEADPQQQPEDRPEDPVAHRLRRGGRGRQVGGLYQLRVAGLKRGEDPQPSASGMGGPGMAKGSRE